MCQSVPRCLPFADCIIRFFVISICIRIYLTLYKHRKNTEQWNNIFFLVGNEIWGKCKKVTKKKIVFVISFVYQKIIKEIVVVWGRLNNTMKLMYLTLPEHFFLKNSLRNFQKQHWWFIFFKSKECKLSGDFFCSFGYV